MCVTAVVLEIFLSSLAPEALSILPLNLGCISATSPYFMGLPSPPSGPLGQSFSSLGLDPPVGPMSPPQSAHSSALQLVEVEVAPVKAFLKSATSQFLPVRFLSCVLVITGPRIPQRLGHVSKAPGFS